MTREFCHPSRLSLASVALLLFIGCQSEPETLPALSVDVPEQFEEDGVVWKQQHALTRADKDCLSKFFEKNGDLVGSPEFNGTPAVYVAGRSDRRFYWLLPSAEDARWCRVEFRNRKFEASDGIGSPFP